MTQFYIGSKQVLAWPQEKEGKDGYAVQYSDGYISWSPKETFESAYLPMGEGNDGSRITAEMVDGFILKLQDQKLGKSTTLVMATLANGFTFVETSGAVDPANYDHTIGVNVCTKRIKDRVWHLLGFLLATARHGVQR